MRSKVIKALPLFILIALAGCQTQEYPLLRAAQNGDAAAVRSLLDGGAQVNVKDVSGRTALMYSTAKNQKEVVELLLERGAEVNARNNKGETALIMAARDGHPEILQTLLLRGADVNVVDNAGFAPVVYAAQFNHPATLKVLLEVGRADVSGSQGQTALRLSKDHPEVIELLKSAGARE